jgi:hypothetical protein
VKKLVLASAAAVVAVATQAQAQFKALESQPLENWTSLECAVVGTTDRDMTDRVYKVEVNITLDDSNRHLKELYVAHTTLSGRLHVRSEQYTNGRIWQTPGKTDWFWTGNRGHGSMRGEVWRTSDRRWFYTEERLDGRGRVEYRMASQCHVMTGEGP